MRCLFFIGTTPIDGTLTIAAITKDSAAEQANLQIDDIILAVNGETMI